MKRVKFGVITVFLMVAIYFIISCGIFFLNKTSVDEQLRLAEQEPVIARNEILEDKNNVAIQRVPFTQKNHKKASSNSKAKSNDLIIAESSGDLLTVSALCAPEFIITEEPEEQLLPVMFADDEQQGFNDTIDQDAHSVDSYSFVTLPKKIILNGYQIDEETYDTLKVMIGSDLDEFVKLVLQSNNNIISKEACRSCAMFAFFSKINKGLPLKPEEIVILQKTLINLYAFVEKMKSLSKSHAFVMLPEQYEALRDLNRSQSERNNIKLQARKAATAAALKKLQSIKYNN